MWNINSFYKMILSIALILVIFIAELLYCAHSTLMSPTHLSRMLETDAKLAQLTTLVYGGLSQPDSENSSQSVMSRYAVKILNNTDQTWVRSQIFITATGLHKYICSQAVTLPTLDFVPLKAVIRNTLEAQIMTQPETQDKIKKVKTILAVLNNKYFSAIINFGLNNQLVSMLLELAPIRSTGFDSAAILEIIRIYLSFSNKNITLDQASYDIVHQMTEKALEIDRLKDYFDLNLFLEKAFGADHPLLSLKTLVHKVDTSISLSVKVFFWCLLLLLSINLKFKLIKLLKITLSCIIIASVLNLMLSALLINPISSQKLAFQFISVQGTFENFLVNLCVFLFRDFGLYLALQSAIASVFVTIPYLIMKFMFRKAKPPRPSIQRFPVWRLTAIAVIFTLMFGWWNITAINGSIRDFYSNIQKHSEADISQCILEGLKEAGGMHFLKYMQKK